jgi:type II secretory pathway pseudopilin PulG
MGKAGFTIFEMIVVIGIMVFIASLVLANYSGYNINLGVERAANDIASSVRQAQAYGLGVKESQPGSGVFPGYGINFYLFDPNTGLPATSYVLFADLNNDLRYNAGETINMLTIQGNAFVSDICGDQKQAIPGPCGIRNIYIVYLRPMPTVSLIQGNGSSRKDVEIKIQGPRGITKTIVIRSSGEINVE